MKLVSWNTTTCPMSDGGTPSCPSAAWFWVALVIAGVMGMFRRRGARQ